MVAERNRLEIVPASDPLGADRMPGLLLISDESGKLVYANRAIEQRSGFRVAEAIGAVPGRLWGGHMPRPFYQDMWRCLSEEGRPFSAMVENRTKQGKIWPSFMCVAPLGTPGTRLFLAIQPERDAWSAFGKRFSSEWSSQTADAGRLAGWLARWLGGDEVAWTREAGSGDAARWIRTALVIPTQSLFSERLADGELLRVAQVDTDAFATVYAKYWPVVRGYFRRHLEDPFEADDCAQDVFVKAFANLDRYETRNATYQTFLLRIAHRLLLNRLRVKPTFSLDDVPDMRAPGPPPDTLTDQHADLERVFASLREDERQLVEGFYLEGHSIRELAHRVGKSENAVKLVLSRMRRRLKAGD